MARSLQVVSPAGLRKPVSFAFVRAFPESAPAAGASTGNGSAKPRVRDNLVLRVVTKKKTAAKGAKHGRRAR